MDGKNITKSPIRSSNSIYFHKYKFGGYVEVLSVYIKYQKHNVPKIPSKLHICHSRVSRELNGVN